MTCPFCLQPLDDGEDEVITVEGVTAHATCHDLDRSSMHGDWISGEYWR